MTYFLYFIVNYKEIIINLIKENNVNEELEIVFLPQEFADKDNTYIIIFNYWNIILFINIFKP